jgi:pyruvyltransferase
MFESTTPRYEKKGRHWLLLFCLPLSIFGAGMPLFYWNEDKDVNFGDYLSRVIVERIVEAPLECYVKKSANQKKKLLALGSVLYFANEGDVLWGTGLNGKILDKQAFNFASLDVRAVRGPLTRKFLMDNFQIDCPEVYGDPALLFPYLFPEFKRKENPSIPFLIIPHYTDREAFRNSPYENVIFTSEPWEKILEKILDSQFVIGSSMHAVILAEAYGIPARLLRISDTPHNHFLKYQDYFFSTNRPNFQFATSVEEALRMGGEPPFECDLEKLYNSFPIEFWRDTPLKPIQFK